VIVVLATNRLSAIDPAVRRRAAATFEFGRPTDEQRRLALSALTVGLDLKAADLNRLVAATGPTKTRTWGYTFSDLYQRLLPTAVLEVFPDAALTAKQLITVANDLVPTPPFQESV
jgi:SpoVK/Ycf46/Vps4 family AAA+-type ATPase